MPLGLVSTRKLVDKKVFGGKDHAKHLGKVKAFIFPKTINFFSN